MKPLLLRAPTPMPRKLFHEALAEFDTYLRVERNLSPRTRTAYQYDLRRFGDHLIAVRKRAPTVEEVGPEDIRHYLQRLQIDRGYKSTTLSRVIASLRNFFKYCVRMGLLATSPAAEFSNPKKPKKLPVYLVEGELKLLLDSPDLSDWKGVRDLALMTAFAFTGLRLQELVSLNLEDIDFERRTLRVLGKGAKERIVPMNERVVEALNRYLSVRLFTQTPAVFLNFRHERLSSRGVEKIVQGHALRAGIPRRKLSPHKLRHTFATLLHHNGVDILEIQSLLGHASITSTQIYTHTSSARLAGAVRKLESLG